MESATRDYGRADLILAVLLLSVYICHISQIATFLQNGVFKPQAFGELSAIVYLCCFATAKDRSSFKIQFFIGQPGACEARRIQAVRQALFLWCLQSKDSNCGGPSRP